MFKKNVEVSSKHLLGGKDSKQLRAQLLKIYGGVLSDVALAGLLPAKANVVQMKLSNRAVVYAIEGGNPLFFDADGRGSVLLPTVYALAQQPALLPSLATWSEVSPKVLGGADLFLQGILVAEGSDLPPFLSGGVLTLTVPGQPVPFAVGKMVVSRAEALRDGMKGRGMAVLHYYGDLLWALGDQVAPNEGFTKARIFPLQADATPAAPAPAAAEGDALASSLEAVQLGSASNSEDASKSGGASGPAGGVAGADMDSLLEAAVLRGLHSLKTAELPIQSSDFYTKHMIPARPEGVTFDFKQSKYKKLGKLLDKFEKDKVLTQKVIRKQDHIASVNRSHPAYLAAAGGDEDADGAKQARSVPAAPPKVAATEPAAAVRVTLCWRTPSSLRPIFGEAALDDKDRLYDQAEVERALAAYAAREGLEAAGGAIKLDRLLRGGLYNKSEQEREGDAVQAADVVRRLLGKLQQHHRLARQTDQGEVVVVRKGALRPVVIVSERRHGRNVTSVSRLESFGLSPEEMAPQFQRRFQTSCTVSKLPGKEEKDCEILMQGDLLRQVAEYLSSAHGLPAEYMDVKAKAK